MLGCRVAVSVACRARQDTSANSTEGGEVSQSPHQGLHHKSHLALLRRPAVLPDFLTSLEQLLASFCLLPTSPFSL